MIFNSLLFGLVSIKGCGVVQCACHVRPDSHLGGFTFPSSRRGFKEVYGLYMGYLTAASTFLTA